MADLVGKVEVITKNQWGFFNVKIGEDWIGTGEKTPPKFDRGDTIEVDIVTNERGFRNFKKGSAKVVSKAEADKKPANKSKSYGSGSGYGSRDEQFDLRQKQISWQASRNTAIEFAKLVLENDALALPGAKKDKAPAIEEFVNRYTNKFYESTQALSTNVSEPASGGDDLSGEED